VPGDFLDTAAVEGGREGQAIEFQVAAVPMQTAIWHTATYVRQDIVVLPGAGIGTPRAAFTTSKGRNVASAGDGASVVGFSSQFDTSASAAANIIDGTSSFGVWTTAFGQTTNQFVKVQLAQAPQVISQVVLKAPSGSNALKNFQIRVSTTTSDDAAFTTAFTGQYPQNTPSQTFTFARVAARYVELFVADNWGDPGTISVQKLQVWTADRQGGIVSWPFGPPASVAAASSGTTPEAALDDNPFSVWSTPCCQSNTNQFLKVQLGGGQTYSINRVRLLNDPNSGVRDFDIRVSTTTADDAAFTTVLSGTATNDGTRLQEFSFAVVQARYVELFVKTGLGTSLIQLATFQAITPDGANAARLAGVGAFVVDSSAPNTASNAIDADVSTAWTGTPGQPNNQFVKVLLNNDSMYLVDRVKLLGPGAPDGMSSRIMVTRPYSACLTLRCSRPNKAAPASRSSICPASRAEPSPPGTGPLAMARLQPRSTRNIPMPHRARIRSPSALPIRQATPPAPLRATPSCLRSYRPLPGRQ